MPLPRYVIHVGPTKTGSSYLQLCLADAAPALAAHGVCVPMQNPQARRVVHAHAYRAARSETVGDRAAVRAYFAQINAQGFHTVVLTAELMSYLKIGQLRQLRELTGAEQVEIVFAVRRWSDRVPSCWFQEIVNGCIETLPDYYTRLINTAQVNRELDYTIFLDKAASVFGRDALHLLPYSNIRDRGEDIFTRLCTDVLGLQAPPAPPSLGKSVWRTPAPETIELLRSLNTLGRQYRVGTRIFELYRGQAGAIDTKMLFLWMSAAMGHFTIDDHAAELAPYYASLSAYADRLTGADANFEVFQRKRRAAPLVMASYQSIPGTMEAALDIFQQLCPPGARAGQWHMRVPPGINRNWELLETKGRRAALDNRERIADQGIDDPDAEDDGAADNHDERVIA